MSIQGSLFKGLLNLVLFCAQWGLPIRITQRVFKDIPLFRCYPRPAIISEKAAWHWYFCKALQVILIALPRLRASALLSHFPQSKSIFFINLLCSLLLFTYLQRTEDFNDLPLPKFYRHEGRQTETLKLILFEHHFLHLILKVVYLHFTI